MSIDSIDSSSCGTLQNKEGANGGTGDPDLNDREQKLIELLRDEATDVKNCFTQYSFQALAIATAALGFMVRYQHDYPYIALLSVPIVILLLAVTLGLPVGLPV